MKIWFLTFESKDTKKVGGLAEVPPRLGEALKKMGYEVEIIVPNHGFIQGYRGDGLVRLYSFKTLYGDLEVYMYTKPSVKHIIISGSVLDELEIYSPKYLMDKVKVWALGIKHYYEVLEERRRPDIIHGNDWLSVPSLVLLRSIDKSLRLYYQIHLLSKTYFSLEDVTYDLGLDPSNKIYGLYGLKSIREYYELSNGYADRLGGLLSNKLLTVSKNYVREVVRRTGFDLEDHVDYIPNATTWRLDDILEKLKTIHPEIKQYLSIDSIIGYDRINIRKYLLLKALRDLGKNEPIVDDRGFREFLEKLDIPPFTGKGRVEGFNEDGPLVIMTGRVSRQKGIHVLLRAFEDIVSILPEIKVLLLLLPVWSDLSLINDIVEHSILFRENLRVIFGRAPSIYGLAHIASNTMVAPSIYEPFGLIALESMVCGSPVVASYTGGLAETVVDIRRYGVIGTGLHITPSDCFELAHGLTDMVLFMETLYYKPWSREWIRLVERIDNRVLRELLISNPRAPLLVRKSCMKRADQYSWDNSAKKALLIYGGK
ncbi:MAG: glycosyl transferase family 1 [Desulfurococcales archaeon ex4484_58]|nr:MAG: glycosyl transferase family 1 [Desulfurococcales archaeon ex4484_58]